jgi:hypothetical protein
LYGRHICGVRGGAPFKDIIRPDPLTNKCEGITKKCSENTSPDNTICSLNVEDCPITYLEFVELAGKDYFDPNEFEVSELQINGKHLVTSKFRDS